MKNTVGKINTFGNVGFIISKIGMIAVMIAAIACLVATVLTCFIPKEAAKIEFQSANTATVTLDEKYDLSGMVEFEQEGTIEIANNSFTIVSGDEGIPTVKSTFYLSNLKWILLVACIACAAAYFPFLFASKLCKNLKNCQTPFTAESSKQLMNLAWSLIPMSVIGSLTESIITSVFTNSVNIGITLDLTVVLLVLCVFMLSYIFKYGTSLQTESDETL